MDWYKLEAEEVTEKLDSDAIDGLTTTEAVRRLEQYGPNQLEERGATSAWVLIMRQFREIMVIILIIAAIVSAILGEFADVVVILAIVILNAAIGFSQEQRAERAMAALKKLAVPTVRVRRNGEVQEISSTVLVPGDVVVLEAGNVVPADGRLLESVNLKIEEAALTGESDAVAKLLDVPEGNDLQIGDRLDMVYMGTVVTYGRGSYIVTDTGMSTELGHIADLIQSVEDEQTPLQRRLAQLGRTLAWAAFGIIAVVVVLGLLRGDELEVLFLTAIGMAVAAVPEGLPAVVTITLALGGQRLLARQALIRKLPAVETLGSVTVICSDKTGTLTENRMTVTMLDVAGNVEDIQTLVDRKGVLMDGQIYDEAEPAMTAIGVLVRAGALVNDAVLKLDAAGVERAIGDPTEGALVVAAARLGYQKDELDERWPRVGEIPFTSERKRMTTIHRMDDRTRQSDLPWSDAPYVLLSKGAVDSLMQVTSDVLVDNEIIPLDDKWRERIEEANANMAREGQRVLGVAFRFWDSAEPPDAEEQLEAEQVFVGMFAMMDPPRPEVEDAVRIAKKAGIRPVMITGDHPLTAHRIAQDLGIAANGDRALTGAELSTMSIEELEACVDEVSVYARVSPEHKLNIVQALQNKGQIAAMTGDGVNDAPALKRADIGVAMGITGTDVSKEAADMVLLDDNFATIVDAVDEGRVIYDNIRKFIKYTLSSNTGELLVMLVGPLLGMPLPLLPLQILWINLVTDGLPGLALAVEKGERGTMDRPPFEPDESVFSRGIGTQIIWVGLLMGLVSLWVGYQFFQLENPAWQTIVFTTLVLAQMGNALAIRSNTDSLFTIGIFSNRLMVTAVLVTFALQLVLIYLPLAQRVFGTVALTLQELLICLLASSVVFIVLEVYKWVRRMRTRQ